VSLFAENPNFPGKLSGDNGLTQHLGGRHSPKNGNLIFAIPADLAEQQDEDDCGRGVRRGMAFALLPSLGVWALIIWLGWRFWPF
jgi:hypothetical protein